MNLNRLEQEWEVLWGLREGDRVSIRFKLLHGLCAPLALFTGYWSVELFVATGLLFIIVGHEYACHVSKTDPRRLISDSEWERGTVTKFINKPDLAVMLVIIGTWVGGLLFNRAWLLLLLYIILIVMNLRLEARLDNFIKTQKDNTNV